MQESQSPSESQLVHSDGLHFGPAHRPLLQVPEEHWDEEEQEPPSDFFGVEQVLLLVFESGDNERPEPQDVLCGLQSFHFL